MYQGGEKSFLGYVREHWSATINGNPHQRRDSREVNARELKTALKRAGETQASLARKLGRSRSMVTDWIRDDAVPAEWVDIVYEALGQAPAEVAEAPLSRYSTIELLIELLDRERKSLNNHGVA